MKTYALLGAAALITSTASATFTSLTVETAFHAGTGRNVYSIFANFSVSKPRGSLCQAKFSAVAQGA